MLIGTEYVVMVGSMTFVYYTPKTIGELASYFMDKINEGKAFIIEMGVPSNMNGLPQLVVFPSPGLMIAIQSKQDFERNSNMQKLVGGGRA